MLSFFCSNIIKTVQYNQNQFTSLFNKLVLCPNINIDIACGVTSAIKHELPKESFQKKQGRIEHTATNIHVRNLLN